MQGQQPQTDRRFTEVWSALDEMRSQVTQDIRQLTAAQSRTDAQISSLAESTSALKETVREEARNQDASIRAMRDEMLATLRERKQGTFSTLSLIATVAVFLAGMAYNVSLVPIQQRVGQLEQTVSNRRSEMQEAVRDAKHDALYNDGVVLAVINAERIGKGEHPLPIP